MILNKFVFVIMIMHFQSTSVESQGFHTDLEVARLLVVKLDVLLWLSESITNTEFNFKALFLLRKDF